MFTDLIFFLVALIYSMVGLGGGSAYVAVLTLSGIGFRYIPATALFLNVIVTLIGFSQFKSHIHQLKGKTIVLLILFSMMGVIIGSGIRLNEKEFRLLLGIVLVVASFITFNKEKIRRLLSGKRVLSERFQVVAVTSGFFIGLIAGLFGIGGGVFLAPVLLVTGVDVKEVAAITSLYIFVNSLTGFISHSIQGNVNLTYLFHFSIFVMVGALIGAYLGSKKFKPIILVRVLTVLIFLIGARLIWTTIL